MEFTIRKVMSSVNKHNLRSWPNSRNHFRRRRLRMKVTEVPVSEELVALQKALAEKSAAAYNKDLRVRIEE